MEAVLQLETAAPERRPTQSDREVTPSRSTLDHLDRLGLTARQRSEALDADPQLVNSWLTSSHGRDVRNPAAVFMAGVRSGSMPRDERSKRSKAQAYVAEHGWPTGSRWARGTHAGTYVKDALGHDHPTYPVPWGRPSIDDIERALVLAGEHESITDPPKSAA
jgi:hypothetical protein